MVINSDFKMDADFFTREELRKAVHAGIGNRGESWWIKARDTRKRDGITVTITDDNKFTWTGKFVGPGQLKLGFISRTVNDAIAAVYE